MTISDRMESHVQSPKLYFNALGDFPDYIRPMQFGQNNRMGCSRLLARVPHISYGHDITLGPISGLTVYAYDPEE
jgi:hypothetical protein